jgi:ribonuclease T2
MNSQLLRAAAAAVALAFPAPAAEFSYYMLALSYTPEVCYHAGAKKLSAQCGPGGKAFVVRGLLPQNDDGRGPEHCGPTRPLGADVVRSMLSYLPGESLIRQEWAAHGACSGLTPAAYFAAVRRLRDSISIPQRLAAAPRPIVLSPDELETEFQRANPGISRDGIRLACYADGGLEEVRICFDKNLNAHPCTGASECTRGAVRMLAVPKPR